MPRKSMSGQGPTPKRTIKISHELWSSFQARCRDEKTTASEVIRRMLAEFVDAASETECD